MTKVDGADRREHPRFALLAKGVARIVHGDRVRDIRVIASDASLGGILLHTDLANIVVPHDRLRLVMATLRDRTKHTLAAQVLWVKADLASEFGRTSFGCKFVSADAKALRQFLRPALEADRLRKITLPY